MKLIDGRALATHIRDEIRKKIETKHLALKLGVLLVGEDPASHLYVNLKEKAARDVGIATDIRRLSQTVADDELIKIIHGWNKNPAVNGILVQLPLPAGHSTDAIIRSIDPKKDADGFHPENVARLLNGQGVIIPPVHEGILRLIAATGIKMNGARATILARSDIFARPLEYLLNKTGAFTAVLPQDDLHAPTLRDMQILVTCVGKPAFLTREHIPPNTVVIDVGTSRLADGKIVGDVDAESVNDLPGWLSPVPGGVGPMTVAMLLKNTISLTPPSPLPARPQSSSAV